MACGQGLRFDSASPSAASFSELLALPVDGFVELKLPELSLEMVVGCFGCCVAAAPLATGIIGVMGTAPCIIPATGKTPPAGALPFVGPCGQKTIWGACAAGHGMKPANCGIPAAPTGTNMGTEPAIGAAGIMPITIGWQDCGALPPPGPKKLGSEPSKNLSEGDGQQVGSKMLSAGERPAGEPVTLPSCTPWAPTLVMAGTGNIIAISPLETD